ncbi:CRISPR-associated endonuclease Cas1 [Candidatus Saccharibacteria bacterium]|nr:CRISPR-associated endonuclease Cas1 [Candidatus Saccharibacteria bacterium]
MKIKSPTKQAHHNKSPNKSRRVPVWIPYPSSISIDRQAKLITEYNGGDLEASLDEISSIMIYGETKTKIEISTLEKIARKGIPIIIHRRNMHQSIIITGSGRPDPDDTLTKQILFRTNQHKRNHIARSLLNAKFISSRCLVSETIKLDKDLTLAEMRQIEAQLAREYWSNFFDQLSPDASLARRNNNPYSKALDASSKFLTGIILRWVSYHHLSPFHGFLHEPTSYPALIYDLIEPYRPIFEYKILQSWQNVISPDPLKLTGIAIDTIKDSLNEQVYVPLTRQIVTRQELLHGIVLSLKHYLLGNQSRLLIPLEGKPNGGRPPKVNFRLYGRQAGKTDFWQQASKVAKNSPT